MSLETDHDFSFLRNVTSPCETDHVDCEVGGKTFES